MLWVSYLLYSAGFPYIGAPRRFTRGSLNHKVPPASSYSTIDRSLDSNQRLRDFLPSYDLSSDHIIISRILLHHRLIITRFFLLLQPAFTQPYHHNTSASSIAASSPATPCYFLLIHTRHHHPPSPSHDYDNGDPFASAQTYSNLYRI